jgi:hypothetical protein
VQNHDTLKLITDAFARVSLGNGVSLREADVIDAYGDLEERAAARGQDELDNWQRIPDEDIESYPDVLCFMDDDGLRFHLPAYMCFALRQYQDSQSRSTNSAVFRLCDPDSIERLRTCFTEQQVDAVIAFLTACLETGDEWLGYETIPLALRQWNGDAAAAAELRAIQDSLWAGWVGFKLGGNVPSGCGGRHPSPSLWSMVFFISAGAIPFVLMAFGIFLRQRHDGWWWIIGVCSIAIAYVAFVLESYRSTKNL